MKAGVVRQSSGGKSCDDHAHDTPSGSRTRQESRVYVFGDDDVSVDESEAELYRENIPLVRKTRTRSSSSSDSRKKHTLVTFAEVPVRAGDTLMVLALRYGCKVITSPTF